MDELLTQPREIWADEITCELPSGTSTDLISQCLEVASEILWALSGRRFGRRPLTVRPIRRCVIQPELMNALIAANPDGRWPWGGPFPFGTSDIASLEEETYALPLQVTPVASVSAVYIDGEVLDSSAYRVDSYKYLVRTDGAVWPVAQDLRLPLTEVGTWGISYYTGHEVPMGGVMACQELACELVKARIGQPCQLPQRVTTISRQGVTLALLDPLKFLEKGRTGLYFCDLWLGSVNPRSQSAAAGIWRADERRQRVVENP